MSIRIPITVLLLILSGSRSIASSGLNASGLAFGCIFNTGHEFYVKEISMIAPIPFTHSTFVNEGDSVVITADLGKEIVFVPDHKEWFSARSGKGEKRR
jgi:hypothetical protein